MKQKPLLITLISFLCLIEPLIKLFYFKATTHFDFATILANVTTRNSVIEIFEFWLLFPLAGLMLTRLRIWTYYTFIMLMAYASYSILNYEQYTWPYNASEPFAFNIAMAAASFGVILFFLMPGTRRLFFDARVRWWEPMVRYNVQIPCEVMTTRGPVKSTILNISKSGVFIEDHEAFVVDDINRIDFVSHGEAFTMLLALKNKHSIKGQKGVGAQFYFDTLNQYLKIRALIKKIKNGEKDPQKTWAKAA